jgi:hypothetical protein
MPHLAHAHAVYGGVHCIVNAHAPHANTVPGSMQLSIPPLPPLPLPGLLPLPPPPQSLGQLFGFSPASQMPSWLHTDMPQSAGHELISLGSHTPSPHTALCASLLWPTVEWHAITNAAMVTSAKKIAD